MPVYDAVVDSAYPMQRAHGWMAPRHTARGERAERRAAGGGPFTLLIRAGGTMRNWWSPSRRVHMVGEDRDTTTLTFDAASGKARPDGTLYGTSGSATMTVCASEFSRG